MINRAEYRKRVSKLGFLLMLLVLTLLLPAGLTAQEDTKEKDTTETVQPEAKEEATKPEAKEPKEPGFFGKIWGFFKFRKNRDSTEVKRVENIVKGVNKEDSKLKTDSIKYLNKDLKKLAGALDSIKEKLAIKDSEEAIHKLEIDYTADDLAFQKEKRREQLDAEVIEHKEEGLKLKKETDGIFDDLQETIHGYRSKLLNENDVAIDSFVNAKGDTVLFKKCLKPRIPIIGWHNAAKEDNSENYNFNFLTAINYYGFELQENGTTKWTEYFSQLQRPEIIERARVYGNDVYLTIYNKDEQQIANFLQSDRAQENLMKELESLRNDSLINGVNVYFEELPSPDNGDFVSFFQKLHNRLVKNNDEDKKGISVPFRLIITIPPITNFESQVKANAYDFEKLNAMVDYYMVLTDRMTNLNESVAQSLSPLFNSAADDSGTIDGTYNFYRDEKRNIGKEQLIITLSYSGIEWDVDLSGNLIGSKGKEITYDEILDNYKYNIDETELLAFERFDKEQATAIINVTERDSEEKYTYKQIWYDDARSLNTKYKWALDKGIGVAIRDLNNDKGDTRFGDEYLKLWKVLGATLVKNDSCIQDTIYSRKLPLAYYLEIFGNDFKWAMLNEPAKNEEWEYIDFLKPEVRAIEDKLGNTFISRRGFFGIDKRYFVGNKVKKYLKVGYDDPELDTREQSLYAFLRWRIYARIFLFGMLIFSLLALGLYYAYTWHKRFRPKKVKRAKRIQNLSIPVTLFAIGCLLMYLYFEPEVDIGGSANQWIALDTLIILLVIGLALGIWITPHLRSKTLVPKGMP